MTIGDMVKALYDNKFGTKEPNMQLVGTTSGTITMGATNANQYYTAQTTFTIPDSIDVSNLTEDNFFIETIITRFYGSSTSYELITDSFIKSFNKSARTIKGGTKYRTYGAGSFQVGYTIKAYII